MRPTPRLPAPSWDQAASYQRGAWVGVAGSLSTEAQGSRTPTRLLLLQLGAIVRPSADMEEAAHGHHRGGQRPWAAPTLSWTSVDKKTARSVTLPRLGSLHPIRARLTLHGPALVSSGLAGSQRPRLQVAPPPWARSRPS